MRCAVDADYILGPLIIGGLGHGTSPVKNIICHPIYKVQKLRRSEKIANVLKNVDAINYVEGAIQQMILRFMELNEKYSFKQINEALNKALYISKPPIEILEDG